MSVKAYSIFHIPPNGVEVTNGEVIAVSNSAGADPHNAVAVVANGAISGLELQSAAASFVDNGDSVTVVSNTPGLIETATAEVAAGVLTQVRLPTDVAMLEAGQALTVSTQGGAKSAQAQPLIGGGILAAITLTFDTLVANGDATGVQNSAGSKTVSGATAHLALNRVLDYVTLPATAALVTGADTCTLRWGTASGPTTTITAAVAAGVISQFTMASGQAFVIDGGSVEVVNQADNQGVQGAIGVNSTANTIQIKLPASTSMVVNGNAIQVPVTGTYTNTITPTVDNAGNITGFVLS